MDTLEKWTKAKLKKKNLVPLHINGHMTPGEEMERLTVTNLALERIRTEPIPDNEDDERNAH